MISSPILKSVSVKVKTFQKAIIISIIIVKSKKKRNQKKRVNGWKKLQRIIGVSIDENVKLTSNRSEEEEFTSL